MCQDSDIEIKSQVHDSVLMQLPNDIRLLMDTADALRDLMRVNITIKGKTFYIPIDIQWGYNWGKMYSIEFLYERD